MEKNETSIDFMKPLHYMANLLALVPPLNTRDVHKLTKYKGYCVFIIMVILCGYCSSVPFPRDKGRTSVGAIVNTLNILDITLSSAMLTVTMLSSAFWNIQAFESFITGLGEVGKHFTNKPITSLKVNHIFVELFLMHFIYVGLFTFDLSTSIINPAVGFYRQRLVDLLQQYVLNILVLLIYNYCKLLKRRYKDLNVQLNADVTSYLKRPTSTKVDNKVRRFVHEDNPEINDLKIVELVKKAGETYSQLTDLAELFNKLFGWQLLFLFSIIALHVLELISRQMATYVDRDLQIVLLLWTFVYTTMGITVAATCDMTMEEAHRTATVCHNLLLDIPTASNNYADRLLEEELNILAQQAIHHSPCFSAAGFFVVDYGLLLGVCETVTAYTIVILQINQ